MSRRRGNIVSDLIAYFLSSCKHLEARIGEFDKMPDIFIPFRGFIIREESRPMIEAAGYCRRPIAGVRRGA
jgi:hypothetical protein